MGNSQFVATDRATLIKKRTVCLIEAEEARLRQEKRRKLEETPLPTEEEIRQEREREQREDEIRRQKYVREAQKECESIRRMFPDFQEQIYQNGCAHFTYGKCPPSVIETLAKESFPTEEGYSVSNKMSHGHSDEWKRSIPYTHNGFSYAYYELTIKLDETVEKECQLSCA